MIAGVPFAPSAACSPRARPSTAHQRAWEASRGKRWHDIVTAALLRVAGQSSERGSAEAPGTLVVRVMLVSRPI